MYRASLFPQEKVIHAASTIDDGNMSFSWGEHEEVISNRKRFVEQLGISTFECVNAEIVHQSGIQIVDKHDAGRGMITPNTLVPCTDALITAQPGVYLFMTVADCIPISIYDPIKGVATLIHHGWRNVDAHFVQDVVSQMQQVFASNPADLLVNLGPCIHQESYLYPKDKWEKEEVQTYERWKPYIKEFPGDILGADIIGFTSDQLVSCGVPTEHIEIAPIDVASNKEYFSHYRTLQTGEKEGRFGVIFGMRA